MHGPNSLNFRHIIISRLKSDAIFYSFRDINDYWFSWAIIYGNFTLNYAITVLISRACE